jgi:hypothetical protein
MAMKVTKTSIQRLTVEMSCGCRMFGEFKDTRYKEAEGEKVFIACDKHRDDAGVTMLEFILAERVDEAAEEASKVPVFAQRQIQEGDTSGVVATGESVQRMGMNMPKRNPLDPKKLERNNEQLKQAGAAPVHVEQTTAEMQIDELPEDEGVTDVTLDFLSEHDTEDASR